MPIDPVVAITEKLLQAERALRDCRLNRDEKMTTRLLALIARSTSTLQRGAEQRAGRGNCCGARRTPSGARRLLRQPHARDRGPVLGRDAGADRPRLAALDPAGATGGLCGNDGSSWRR